MSTRRDWWHWALGFCAGSVLASYLTLSCAVGHGAPHTQSVPELIDRAATEWGIPWAAGHLRKIAFCESRFFPGAYNRSSGASGVYQFVPSTWRWSSWGAGFGGASVFDAVANVYSGVWLYKYHGARHWVCR